MEKEKNKNQIKKYFIYFMFYAIIGWIYEVFLEVVVYKWGFTNRGVLFGPYCPVYGVGALAFIFTIYRLINGTSLKKKIIMLPVVFLGCMFIATAIELLTSYICEAIMGYWPWQTYSDYAINFQGRIALSPSIRFGLGGILFLYVLQPLFEKICNSLKTKWLNVLFIGLLSVFGLDLLVKVVSFMYMRIVFI